MNLKKYFRDYNFTEKELNDLLNGRKKQISHIKIEDLYARILTTTRWYEAIEIIGKKNIKRALSGRVLKKIYPNSLKHKFEIAGKILSE